MGPDALGELLLARLGEAARAEVTDGLLTVDVPHPDWLPALQTARDDAGCDFFDWLSAVDELDDGFRVVAHLYSLRDRHHLLLRTLVDRERPAVPSAVELFRGAAWHERETHEMFGIDFPGHPNLVPLLLPDGFEGNPLRKDFVLASRVAKQWPGEVDPGQSFGELAPRRRRNLPPGVPAPGEWGPPADAEPPRPRHPRGPA
jgi:NADH-quinone oxidoreductase subunit C